MANISQSIKLLLVKRNKTVKELAGLIGISPNSLYNKLKVEDGSNFKVSELNSIAKALDCEFDAFFQLNDSGEKF